MIPAPLNRAASDPRLRGDALRVLIRLHDWCGYHHLTPIKLNAVARSLGLAPGQVSRALRALQDAGFVERGPFDATAAQWTFRLGTGRAPAPTLHTEATRQAA